MSDLLRNVSEWHLEARDDEDHYFFETRHSDSIQDGRRIFAIGRKGTGKTAICEHIHNTKSPKKFSILQSFKNFPFNEIYQHGNDSFKKPNRFITVWKYTIYTAICRLMLDNENIDPTARDTLSKIFNFKLEEAFARRLRRITDRGFGVQILGSGISADASVESGNNNLSLSERCDIIEEFIENHIDDSKYFVLFDELDEDYKDILVSSVDSGEYFELLVSLFKAAQEVHSHFGRLGRNIFPVIFLRDDIFDLLRDHDKPKWSDKSVDLNWDQATLKELLAFRINRAINAQSTDRINFNDEWSKLFAVKNTTVNNRWQRSIPTFNYLLKCTYLRPRDLISYVRQCAKLALSDGKPRADNATIKSAEKKHSEFMRAEIVAEMYSIVPEISEILDMLSEVRKQIMTRKEFNDQYRNLQKRLLGEKSDLPTGRVLELLYYFGAIGNITKGNHQIFKYDSPRSVFNRNENICIHRSLLKALDIY